MGSFFEHFIGNANVPSNLVVECDYNGLVYLSFAIDGKQYVSGYTWNMNDYELFDHHYNTMVLKGYDDNHKMHKFQATIDRDPGPNHNKLINLSEIK